MSFQETKRRKCVRVCVCVCNSVFYISILIYHFDSLYSCGFELPSSVISYLSTAFSFPSLLCCFVNYVLFLCVTGPRI